MASFGFDACVGLDPDPSRFPAHLDGVGDAIFHFCREIVDATADAACVLKPQIAYFASQRAEGSSSGSAPTSAVPTRRCC